MPNQTNLCSHGDLAGQFPQKIYTEHSNTAANFLKLEYWEIKLLLGEQKSNYCMYSLVFFRFTLTWEASLFHVQSWLLKAEISHGAWQRGSSSRLTALTERMSSAGRPFRTWNRTSSGRLNNVRTRGRFLILRFEGKEKHLEHLQWITGKQKHGTPQLVMEQYKGKRHYRVYTYINTCLFEYLFTAA